MFPIRDHNPSGRTPFVVYTLIVANLLGFAMSGAMTVDDGAMMVVFADWALIPARVSEGRDWSTFVSSMFLHGGWMHLLGNMLFLWIFGDNLEDAMGHLGFALFYLAAGIGAGITSLGLALLYGLLAAQMVMGLSRSLVRHLGAPLLGVWLVSMVLLLLLGIAISVGRVPVVAITPAPGPPTVDTNSDGVPTDTASDPEPAADP